MRTSKKVLRKHVAINQQDIKASTSGEGLRQTSRGIFSGVQRHLVLTSLRLLYRHFFSLLIGRVFLGPNRESDVNFVTMHRLGK